MSKIKIVNLFKKFGSKIILNNISFDIKEGKSYAIIGSSGTGKSVLIKSIIGLIEPCRGSVYMYNQDYLKLSYGHKLKLMSKFGFLFQGSALFDSLTIEDNISFFYRHRYAFDQKEIQRKIHHKLELVGLDNSIVTNYPSELSGGMQKRVSLARSIFHDPEIIFYDEPTTGLDPIMSSVITNLINRVNKELGSTSVIISHDMVNVKKAASEIFMLHEGNIIWKGKNSELFNSGNDIVNNFVNGISLV